MMCIIAITFIVITFVQPQLPIFKDPRTGTYGIRINSPEKRTLRCFFLYS